MHDHDHDEHKPSGKPCCAACAKTGGSCGGAKGKGRNKMVRRPSGAVPGETPVGLLIGGVILLAAGAGGLAYYLSTQPQASSST